ncbi:ankyrin repeat-containing domain protein [Mycena olivaceomarginata]|nr:ankyrin repeat-containing domain protein [Mycena olivaceomarginata]
MVWSQTSLKRRSTTSVKAFCCQCLLGTWKSPNTLGEGAAVNFAPSNRVTPLYCAASTGNLELVQFLLASGADPDLRAQYGIPPLFNAAGLDIVRALLAAGANIHAKGRESQNVLPLVVDKSVEMLRFFLEHGVDPNHEDVFGRTPLHYACQRNVTAPVELLLQFGAATVEKADGAGRTPVDHAMRTASLKVIKVLQPLVQNSDLEAKIARWWKKREENLEKEDVLLSMPFVVVIQRDETA